MGHSLFVRLTAHVSSFGLILVILLAAVLTVRLAGRAVLLAVLTVLAGLAVLTLILVVLVIIILRHFIFLLFLKVTTVV